MVPEHCNITMTSRMSMLSSIACSAGLLVGAAMIQPSMPAPDLAGYWQCRQTGPERYCRISYHIAQASINP